MRPSQLVLALSVSKCRGLKKKQFLVIKFVIKAYKTKKEQRYFQGCVTSFSGIKCTDSKQIESKPGP